MKKFTGISEPRWTSTREVLMMSGPIVLGSLSYTVMEFCDKLMVSQLGTDEIAAAGSASIWSWMLGTVLFGIVGCVATFVAQCIGRDEYAHCARYTWQGIYLSLVAGLVALPLWPLSGSIFRLMGHSASVTQLEISYFNLRLLGYLPMAGISALAAFFMAINQPRIPMYVAMVAMVLNVALNFLLIFGSRSLGIPVIEVFGFSLATPRLELGGAAIATVLAQWLQMVLLLCVFLNRKYHKKYATRTTWAIDMPRMRELLSIGLPSGFGMFLDVANWGIFTSFIIGRFGSEQLAAHNIALSFMHISFMPAVAMSQGISAIVGQWIGRQDIPRAKLRTYTGIRITALYMMIMGATFAIFGGRLVGWMFSDDPEVIWLAHRLLILAAVFQGFDAVNIICMGALRGAGDTHWMMRVMFAAAYLFFLPLSIICAMALHGKAFGAWIAATVYVTGLSSILFKRFQGERWRDINIFSQTSTATAAPPAAESMTDGE